MKKQNKKNTIEYEEEEESEEELEARMWAEECERAKTYALEDFNKGLL
jgi:hypothetical protein